MVRVEVFVAEDDALRRALGAGGEDDDGGLFDGLRVCGLRAQERGAQRRG